MNLRRQLRSVVLGAAAGVAGPCCLTLMFMLLWTLLGRKVPISFVFETVAKFASIAGILLVGCLWVLRIERLPQQEHLRRLDTLPWVPGKPLLRGAYRFGLGTWSFLLALALACFLIGVDPVWIVGFAFVLQVAWGAFQLLQRRSRYWWAAYIAFGTLILLVHPPGSQIGRWVCVGVVFLLMVWIDTLVLRSIVEEVQRRAATDEPPPRRIPVTASFLRPDVEANPRLKPNEWIGISVLLALVGLVAVAAPFHTEDLVEQLWCSLLFVLVGLFRWGILRNRFSPPLSLWGRLAKGPRIIPHYDVIVLPLLLTLLVAVAGFGLGWVCGEESIIWVLPLTCFVGMATALKSPPDPFRFALTAPSLARLATIAKGLNPKKRSGVYHRKTQADG